MPLLYRMVALVVFLLAPMLVAPAGAQSPERRFALVIGNSEYKAGRHPTAANDAGLVAETLRNAGFDVAGARDLDQDTLRRSIREFLDKVSAAGPQAVSVIYLAGYGVQFEGENYFVPVDATIAHDEDIPIETIRISDFTRPLSSTPGGVKLVIVDTARQHPYTPAGTPLASGLALVDPDPGTLIAFNTAPGSVAPLENGPYGAFAQALTEMIGVGGIGLDDVFARVRLRVNETTGGVSVPWYASKITQPFVSLERTPDAPPPPQVTASMQLQSQPIAQFRGDQEAYTAALERDTIAGYEEFVAAFPDSMHVRRIRALVAVRREAILWRRVVSLNTQEAFWSYLERYPQGAHVADAERRLARLAAALDPPPAFAPMAFADVPPPPPDEVVYLAQPQIMFDDPVFVPPPPVPAFFCPPAPPEFVALPPPPPPIGAFFLPAPAVSFFSGPRPSVRPPGFVVAPPRPPVQQLTINNTTISNTNTSVTTANTVHNERQGGVGLMSPPLPGAVVTRVNSGALHVPPPAPPAPVLAPPNASRHPGVGVLGTQVQVPPRMHAATLPGGPVPAQVPAPPPGVRVPGPPGGAPQQRQPAPNTATTTPGTRLEPVPPGAPQHQLPNTVPPPGAPPAQVPPRPPQHPLPNTATTTPGTRPEPVSPGAPQHQLPNAMPPPGAAPAQVRPGPPQHPSPNTATTTPGAPPAHVTPPAAPPMHAPPPPPVTHNPPPPRAAPHVAAPPPAPAHVAPAPPPPPAARPAPPAHPAPSPARPAPAPPVAHAAPPVAHAAPPPAAPGKPPAAPGKKCETVQGRQVCR